MAIRVYQAFLSPLMFSSCRYYPTCSQYAYDAIAIQGAARGVWLALKRLLRCHPFSRGGFDPVPIAIPSAPPARVHRSDAQQSALCQEWAATQERAANQE
jgi:putative membrane protein insertion efficiency factor